MSIFSKYEKSLNGLRVASFSDVKDPNTGDIRSDVDYAGKIDRKLPSYVLKANKRGRKTAFLEDVNRLPKRVKQDVVNTFFDAKGNSTSRQTVYLVRTDKDSKTESRALAEVDKKIKQRKAAEKNGGKASKGKPEKFGKQKSRISYRNTVRKGKGVKR